MLRVSEAKESILSVVRPLPANDVALSDAFGCVLADDLVSSISLPPWDNSAVDGYAVRAGDVDSAGENNPIHLRVLGELPAGKAATQPVEPLACVRIFTGAPIPPEANAVVMQENTRPHHEGFIAVVEAVEPGENIRRAGEDVRVGEPVLRAGSLLGPAQIAMAAGVGAARLRVHPQPRVGVLVTGAEIVEPGQPLLDGQIYDANSYALAGFVRAAGCEAVDLGIADDTREALTEKIEYALAECDALLTVGGVSVGEYDLVKTVLSELGCEQKFWQVSIRPGKPFVFASKGEKLVFGLPGNPVSAAVTFLILARPALLRLRGLSDLELPTLDAEVAEEFVNDGDRTHFMRAVFEWRDGKRLVKPLPRQDSHMISSLANAQCLVEVASGDTIQRGAHVRPMVF